MELLSQIRKRDDFSLFSYGFVFGLEKSLVFKYILSSQVKVIPWQKLLLQPNEYSSKSYVK